MNLLAGTNEQSPPQSLLHFTGKGVETSRQGGNGKCIASKRKREKKLKKS